MKCYFLHSPERDANEGIFHRRITYVNNSHITIYPSKHQINNSLRLIDDGVDWLKASLERMRNSRDNQRIIRFFPVFILSFVVFFLHVCRVDGCVSSISQVSCQNTPVNQYQLSYINCNIQRDIRRLGECEKVVSRFS